MTDERARRLLARLPDVPRWTETRGALLAGAAEIFGSERDCVVRIDEQRLLSVVGAPGESVLEDALVDVETEWTLICGVEAGEEWFERLPGWRLETAVLHELAALDDPLPAPAIGCDVRAVAAPSSGLLDHLPSRLRREIVAVAGRWPLWAAWVDGRAVSFCYAAYPTETLWDVSVDTLEGYRRAGLAGACAARAIRELGETGRGPVWGAVESNTASLRLAAKLGFRPVDRLAVLER